MPEESRYIFLQFQGEKGFFKHATKSRTLVRRSGYIWFVTKSCPTLVTPQISVLLSMLGWGGRPEPKPTVLFSFLLDAWKVGLCGSKWGGHVCPASQGKPLSPREQAVLPATLFPFLETRGSWPALGTCSSQSTEYERLGVRWSCAGRRGAGPAFPGGRPWIPSPPLPLLPEDTPVILMRRM